MMEQLSSLLELLRAEILQCEEAVTCLEKETEARDSDEARPAPVPVSTRGLALLARRLARADDERAQEEGYQSIQEVTGRTEKGGGFRSAPAEIPGYEKQKGELAHRTKSSREAMELWSAWVDKFEGALKEYRND